MNKKVLSLQESYHEKKNGRFEGKQIYKCGAYGHQFLGGNRLNPELIWLEYREGKQTYLQLAKKYGCSTRTIQRRIVQVKVIEHQSVPEKLLF